MREQITHYALILTGIVVAVVYCWSLFSHEWCVRYCNIKKSFNQFGITAGISFAPLALLALPFGILHNLCTKQVKVRIELWVLFWTAFDFYLVIQVVGKLPLLGLLPIIRLLDLLYIIVKVFLFSDQPKPPERALVLLLVHYFE